MTWPVAVLRGRFVAGLAWNAAEVWVVDLVFTIVWAAIWLYWLVAAFSTKRGRVPWPRELGTRAIIAAVVLMLYRLGALRNRSLNRDAVGFVLLMAGLWFAVWARRHIGRNWGMPMTEKDTPELVTSGPYRLVRHPIYSGILIAAIRTAVALSLTLADRRRHRDDPLRLQRECRRALLDRAVPGHLSRLQANDQNAPALRVLESLSRAAAGPLAPPSWAHRAVDMPHERRERRPHRWDDLRCFDVPLTPYCVRSHARAHVMRGHLDERPAAALRAPAYDKDSR